MSSFSDRHLMLCENYIYILLGDDIKEHVKEEEFNEILKEVSESSLNLAEVESFMEHTLPRVLRIDKVGIELIHVLSSSIRDYENVNKNVKYISE